MPTREQNQRLCETMAEWSALCNQYPEITSMQNVNSLSGKRKMDAAIRRVRKEITGSQKQSGAVATEEAGG